MTHNFLAFAGEVLCMVGLLAAMVWVMRGSEEPCEACSGSGYLPDYRVCGECLGSRLDSLGGK